MSAPTAASRRVDACPWLENDSCYTARCAEHGAARFKVSLTTASQIVAQVRFGVASGILLSGDRFAVSLDSRDYVALCPRAFLEPLTKVLARHTLRDQIHLEVDGHTLYVVVI